MLHHVLKHRISHVADEQVMLRVPLWEQGMSNLFGGGVRLRLCEEIKIRGFSYRPMRFGVLVTEIRGFSYRDSGF